MIATDSGAYRTYVQLRRLRSHHRITYLIKPDLYRLAQTIQTLLNHPAQDHFLKDCALSRLQNFKIQPFKRELVSRDVALYPTYALKASFRNAGLAASRLALFVGAAFLVLFIATLHQVPT